MAAIIPPWLDITPNTFLGAIKAGASAGQGERQLTDEELALKNAQQNAVQNRQDALNESAAERALKESLSKRALDASQNKQQQLQDFREQELGLRSQGLDVASERLQASLEEHNKKAQDMADSAQLFADTVPNLPEDKPWMPVIAANPKLSTNPGAVAQAKFHDQQLAAWQRVNSASDQAKTKEQINVKLKQAKDAETEGDYQKAGGYYKEAMALSGGGAVSGSDTDAPPDFTFNPDTGKLEKPTPTQ